eukprot:TRINITY_DN1925_c0_g1_i1.p1 TRINITY_DN1925_c0_g1~~TRINITY_DN1925_c0_g1_i1.p1  ORF type:complete len:308 (-),score=33.50 TRINITY_DN1925_c0_g1_i1:99-1022(-)
MGTEKAYAVINRKKLLQFLMRMKQPDGSFIMHESGESDVRGTYCAIAVASLVNILTPELVRGVPEYIARCQTYEGGMGGVPGNEAHGGYTFCAISALTILGRLDVIDKPSLLRWAVERQMSFAGGFQGRTNKLVDSCYSFWMGSIFPQLDVPWKTEYRPTINETPQTVHSVAEPAPEAEPQIKERRPKIMELHDADPTEYLAEEKNNIGFWLFDQRAMQNYIVFCCQDDDGGLRDKPSRSRDFYHTCYALSGLSIAQNNNDQTHGPTILGGAQNLLEPIQAEHGVTIVKVARAKAHFSALPLDGDDC